MGLAEWFSQFCKNIQVQDSGTISLRHRNITHRLNVDFFHIGFPIPSLPLGHSFRDGRLTDRGNSDAKQTGPSHQSYVSSTSNRPYIAFNKTPLITTHSITLNCENPYLPGLVKQS